jgi:hypothetical protein
MRKLRGWLEDSWYGSGLHDMVWEVVVPVVSGIAVVVVAVGLFQWLAGLLNHLLGI